MPLWVGVDVSELDKASSAKSSLFRASGSAKQCSSRLDVGVNTSLSLGSLWGCCLVWSGSVSVFFDASLGGSGFSLHESWKEYSD